MEEEFVRLRLNNTKSTYLNFNNNIYNVISICDSSYFVEIKTLLHQNFDYKSGWTFICMYWKLNGEKIFFWPETLTGTLARCLLCLVCSLDPTSPGTRVWRLLRVSSLRLCLGCRGSHPRRSAAKWPRKRARSSCNSQRGLRGGFLHRAPSLAGGTCVPSPTLGPRILLTNKNVLIESIMTTCVYFKGNIYPDDVALFREVNNKVYFIK